MSASTEVAAPELWSEPVFSIRSNFTALPLAPMDFVELFKDKNEGRMPVFRIDTKASLRNMRTPQALLRFINNSKMMVEFDHLPFSLLKAYLNLNISLQAPGLLEAHANVLHWFKYRELLFPESPMTAQRCGQFIRTNMETVVRQCQFLDSLLLFLLASRSKAGEELVGMKKSELEKTIARKSHMEDYKQTHRVDGGMYEDIGLPLLKLLSIPDFVVSWYRDGMPFHQQIIFSRHFEESMYEGKPLFAYVAQSALMSVLLLPNLDSNLAGQLDQMVRRLQRENPAEDFSTLGHLLEVRSLQADSEDAAG